MIVTGSFPQLSESAVERLKNGDLQRLETEWLSHLTFCVSVYRWQSEQRRGLFCSLAMWMPGMVLRSLDVSRAHRHCKVL